MGPQPEPAPRDAPAPRTTTKGTSTDSATQLSYPLILWLGERLSMSTDESQPTCRFERWMSFSQGKLRRKCREPKGSKFRRCWPWLWKVFDDAGDQSRLGDLDRPLLECHFDPQTGLAQEQNEYQAHSRDLRSSSGLRSLPLEEEANSWLTSFEALGQFFLANSIALQKGCHRFYGLTKEELALVDKTRRNLIITRGGTSVYSAHGCAPGARRSFSRQARCRALRYSDCA